MLWPDEVSERSVQELWAALEDVGVPTLLTTTHRRHRPHVSLVVAEDLDPEAVLGAVGPVPREPLRLEVHSVGLFPEGVLFLACVPTTELLEEQRRVHGATATLVRGPSPFGEAGSWVPHLTLSWKVTPVQAAAALPVVRDALPLRGGLVAGGVEDGATARRWPAQ